jgi:hypothetical protein
MRTQLSLPFAALLTLGVAVAQEAAGKPAAAPVLRILVQPSTAEGVRQNATLEVVERLTTGLARQQLLVVDGKHALQLHDRTQKVFQQFVGGDQPAQSAGEGSVGIAVDADLVITAGIFVEQEVEQQGRFVVRDRLRLRIDGAAVGNIGQAPGISRIGDGKLAVLAIAPLAIHVGLRTQQGRVVELGQGRDSLQHGSMS